jgi:deoxycitidine kinase/deoxyguanosine kinase
MSSPMIVSLEGNIGSGKSTLLRYLADNCNTRKDIVFLQEPVDEWSKITDVDGTTMLEKFYKNQDRYAFSFQMMAYISRLALLKKTRDDNPSAIIVTERSLFTDRHVFAKMLYDTKQIEEAEYKIYLRWFDTFANEYPIDKVIYVKTEPPTCLGRIVKRNRGGETTIGLDYLIRCSRYHNAMVENVYDKEKTLVLDGDEYFDNMKDKWVKEIIQHLEQ